MLPEHAGYAIPCTDREFDFWCECELLDPEADEPENWPLCWDAERWELGPGPDDDQADDPKPTIEPEPFEPTPEDLTDLDAWLAEVELQRDRDEAMARDAMADAEYECRRFREEELVWCGLPIG